MQAIKDATINEIMSRYDCDIMAAESMFDDEIKSRYGTSNLDIAEIMFDGENS